jgi:hypothetical protein
MITVTKSHIHWNYFLALENDLEAVSRYIEFIDQNFQTYSIELAHLLLASSSEIDVIMKELCKLIAPGEDANNIIDYRKIIKSKKPKFADEPVYISRYGISLTPWINWKNDKSPFWWESYNNVKHERNLYFNEANLEHVINSLGALLITNFYYYHEKFNQEKEFVGLAISVTNKLKPRSNLLKLSPEYYMFTTEI